MALAFNSATTDESTSISDTTLVCAAPSGASVDGRLLVAQCSYEEAAPGYGSNIIPPAGWNQIVVASPTSGTGGPFGGTYRRFTWVGWKITASEPANYTFLTPMNTPPFVFIAGSFVDILCYTGIDAANGLDTYTTTFTTTNSSPDFTLPSVTTTDGTVPATTYTQSGGNFTWGVGSTLAFHDDDGGTSPLAVMWMLPGSATLFSVSPPATVDYSQLGPGAPDYGRHYARPAPLAAVEDLRVSFDLRYVV